MCPVIVWIEDLVELFNLYHFKKFGSSAPQLLRSHFGIEPKSFNCIFANATERCQDLAQRRFFFFTAEYLLSKGEGSKDSYYRKARTYAKDEARYAFLERASCFDNAFGLLNENFLTFNTYYAVLLYRSGSEELRNRILQCTVEQVCDDAKFDPN